MPFSIVNIVL